MLLAILWFLTHRFLLLLLILQADCSCWSCCSLLLLTCHTCNGLIRVLKLHNAPALGTACVQDMSKAQSDTIAAVRCRPPLSTQSALAAVPDKSTHATPKRPHYTISIIYRSKWHLLSGPGTLLAI